MCQSLDETKNELHKGDNTWMQMNSTNGLPLMKTSGNYQQKQQQ